MGSTGCFTESEKNFYNVEDMTINELIVNDPKAYNKAEWSSTCGHRSKRWRTEGLSGVLLRGRSVDLLRRNNIEMDAINDVNIGRCTP